MRRRHLSTKREKGRSRSRAGEKQARRCGNGSIGRALKIARTIADLDGAAERAPKHVSEAIQYRSLDRRGGAASTTAPPPPPLAYADGAQHHHYDDQQAAHPPPRHRAPQE